MACAFIYTQWKGEKYPTGPEGLRTRKAKYSHSYCTVVNREEHQHQVLVSTAQIPVGCSHGSPLELPVLRDTLALNVNIHSVSLQPSHSPQWRLNWTSKLKLKVNMETLGGNFQNSTILKTKFEFILKFLRFPFDFCRTQVNARVKSKH